MSPQDHQNSLSLMMTLTPSTGIVLEEVLAPLKRVESPTDSAEKINNKLPEYSVSG